jgi:hypothetical protein
MENPNMIIHYDSAWLSFVNAGQSQWQVASTLGRVRSAYQPPASSTFLSERTSHQQPAATSQQYSSLRTNQHQPSATSQPNRLLSRSDRYLDCAYHKGRFYAVTLNGMVEKWDLDGANGPTREVMVAARPHP